MEFSLYIHFATHPKTDPLVYYALCVISPKKNISILVNIATDDVTSLFHQRSRKREINQNIALLLRYLDSAKMQLPHYCMD